MKVFAQDSFERVKRDKTWIYFSAVIGMTSLMFQTASIKVLFNFFAQSTVVTSIVISTYLAGLASGNWIVIRINVSSKDLPAVTLRVLWLTQALIVFYALGLLQNTDVVWGILDLKKTWPPAGYAVIFLYLLPIGLLTGICLPLLTGCYLHAGDDSSPEGVFHKPTAQILAWDTLGSILGCLISGAWLIPVFGLALTLQVASGIAWVTASAAMCIYRRRLLEGGLLAVVGISTIAWLGISTCYQTAEPGKIVYFTPPHGKKEIVLFQKESPFGTVRVTTDKNQGSIRRLFINLRTMEYSRFSHSERALARLTMAQVNKTFPEGDIRVLNIGLGGGLTAGELLTHPRVKLTISEINAVIVEAARKYYKHLNYGVLERKNRGRVELRIENGLETIRNSPDHYWHAVVIDIEEPTIIYSSGLYTLEAFESIARKLVPDGVMGLWAHSQFNEYAKVLYNTMESAFPSTQLRLLPGSLPAESIPGGAEYESQETWSDPYYVFWGSRGSLDEVSRKISPQEAVLIERIKQLPIYEINTLTKPVLEKYFKINDWFGLPADYTEKFYGESRKE